MNDITAQAGINEDLLSRISAQAEDKEMCLTARELIKRGLIRKVWNSAFISFDEATDRYIIEKAYNKIGRAHV